MSLNADLAGPQKEQQLQGARHSVFRHRAWLARATGRAALDKVRAVQILTSFQRTGAREGGRSFRCSRCGSDSGSTWFEGGLRTVPARRTPDG